MYANYLFKIEDQHVIVYKSIPEINKKENCIVVSYKEYRIATE